MTEKGAFGLYREGKVASIFLNFKNSSNFLQTQMQKSVEPDYR